MANAPLAVTEHVPASGTHEPVVVLVHGSLDRASSFARVRRRLVDLPTIVYDRRGYHHSRRDGTVHTTLDGHVDDLLTVVDGRKAVVVGHSLGGIIALLAVARSGGPRPFVAVGAYEPPLPWLGRSGADDTSAGAEKGPPPSDRSPDDAAERFFRRMVGDTAWDRLPDRAKAARRAEGPALHGELSALARLTPPLDVTTITVPAVFGMGERSSARHRAAVTWLADRTPGARLLELEGAGHGAHLTHPDGFAAFVRAVFSPAASHGAAPATGSGWGTASHPGPGPHLEATGTGS